MNADCIVYVGASLIGLKGCSNYDAITVMLISSSILMAAGILYKSTGKSRFMLFFSKAFFCYTSCFRKVLSTPWLKETPIQRLFRKLRPHFLLLTNKKKCRAVLTDYMEELQQNQPRWLTRSRGEGSCHILWIGLENFNDFTRRLFPNLAVLFFNARAQTCWVKEVLATALLHWTKTGSLKH